MKTVMITSFTDPLCTWCWGEEPVFRKIETHFGDQVNFRFIMGGLVEDFGASGWPWNAPGRGGIPEGNKVIGKHWEDASSRHGMPTVGEKMDLFDEEYRSSFPQNIAVKGAEIIDPDKAPVFLHRLREASSAEGLKTSREDVLISLASAVGLDTAAFIGALRDGSAQKAFEQDRGYAQSLGITGFPTCIVQYGDKSVLLNGYNNYETFVAVIERISDGKIKPLETSFNGETILDLLKKYGRLAPEEIRQAFDFPDRNALEAWLEKMSVAGKVRRIRMGNGETIEAVGQTCVNGSCAI